MKKRLILLLLVVVLSICIFQFRKDNSIKLNKMDDVNIMIKEDTLSRVGATVVITDFSNEKNNYDEWYQIDMKINGKWKKLKSKSSWTNLVNYHVNENRQIEFDINWESVYGKLRSGKYRLIKKINDDYIGVEFEIS